MTEAAMLGDDLELELMPALGLHPGVVVSSDDPDKGGRLRVRVDAFYGRDDEDEKIPDDRLPWARPCFPVTGNKEGEAWVPEKDASVWVAFWDGDREKPVWLGGWFPLAKIPSEFSSSYQNGPKTRLIKAGGHTFEMRWKEGQEHVYIKTKGGLLLDLVDSPALGGPKIVGQTPGLRTFYVDDKLQKAGIETPTQKVTLNDATAKILVTTPGTLEATAGVEAKITVAPTILDLTPASATITSPVVNVVGTTSASVTAPQVAVTTTTPSGGLISSALLTFALAMTLAFAGALVLSGAALTATFAAAVFTFTTLNVVSASINLGVLVNVKKLLNELYHSNVFKPHQHPIPAGTDAGGGITGGVSAYGGAGVDPGGLAAAMTSNVQAS